MGDRTKLWNDLAAQIAVDSIRATTAAGSGHPTSSMSMRAPARGAVRRSPALRHQGPGLSRQRPIHPVEGARLARAVRDAQGRGAFDDDELLSLRAEGSPLQGHPAPLHDFPWVDVATGSLGQGLAVGLGMALAMRLDGTDGCVWVLLGDSEMAEGSVWEAMDATAFHGASNVTAILDLNRLGSARPDDARLACRRVP